MALGADRRDMPSANPAQAGEPPGAAAGLNLFAPISTANRITGESRQSRLHTREQHLREQLTSGSSYDYGRVTDEPFPVAPAFSSGTFTASYSAGAYTTTFDRVPPTFLHRTMLAPGDAASAPAPADYGLARMSGQEALKLAYQESRPLTRPDFTADAGRLGSAPGETVFSSGLPLPDTAIEGGLFAVSQGAQPAGRRARARAEAARPDMAAEQGFSPAHTAAEQPFSPAHTAAEQPFSPAHTAAEQPFSPAHTAAEQGFSPAMTAATKPFSPARTAAEQPFPPAMTAAAQSIPPYLAKSAQPERLGRRTRARMEPLGEPAAPINPPVADGRARRAAGYVPRHGGGEREVAQEPAAPYASTPTMGEIYAPAIEVTPYAPAPQPEGDIWQRLGWKAAEPSALETTAIWSPSGISMFERAAFEEPLDPLRNPPAARVGYAAAYNGGAPYSANAPSEGYTGPYAPPRMDEGPSGAMPGMWDSQAEPPARGAGSDGMGGSWQDTPPPAARPPRGQQPYRQPRGESRLRAAISHITVGRLVLYVCIALALTFCLIEGVKMMRSLWSDEHTERDYTAAYGQLSGGVNAVSGVELLPEGVTYAPTATPVAASTATPTERIPQNDPLIGVLDSGGGTPSAVLPTPSPVIRTRLTKYTDNALLSVSDALTALQTEYREAVARLTIDGLLDEVVVQRNNTFYLNHNARGALSDTGAVFVDEGCRLMTPPENLLLRAQAHDDGKLFAPLLQYERGGKPFLAQHGIVRCDTLYEQAQYVIFSVFRADSVVGSADYFNYAGYPAFPSDMLMMNYVQAAKGRSLISISVGVRPTDRLLTLATVAEGSDTTSLVVLCRMLRTGESAAYIAQD